MRTAIVWLRRELRVHDNPALTAAVREFDRVVPVFVLDERLIDGRFPSRSRAWFLFESLRELRESLRARGGDLLLRPGPPERALPALAAQTGAEAVLHTADVSPFAVARDRRVEAALDVELRRCEGVFVTDVHAVERPYGVFSPFWRAWRALPRREVHGAPPAARLPDGLGAGDIPHARPEASDPPPPGERAGRARMHAFLRDDLQAYADRHDRLAGGTSGLSPYLHFGCVSARELEHRASACGAFTRQLAWRDFYAHVLLRNPANTRRAFKTEMDALEWEHDDDAFAAWAEGRTGYPVVDAGMRQLLATGWMHNRARLLVASFLTKDLHIDWRRGEAHFMRHLLCGDVAQNNGNWQWVSSVGVDPAPYFKRLYNPELQQRRHDPDGAYVRRWVPEAGTPAYPPPIVDHRRERARAIERYRAVLSPPQ